MLKNRPITFFGVSLGAGIVIGLFFSFSVLFTVLTAVASGIFAFIFMKRWEKYIFITLLGICVGFLYSSFYCEQNEKDGSALCGKELVFTALVQNITPYYSDSELTLLVTECESAEAEDKRFLMIENSEGLKIGDTVLCTAKVTEASSWDKADGFYFKAYGEINEILPQRSNDVKSTINLVRSKISNKIAEVFEPLSPECSAFFRAVLIGDRSGIDSTVTAKFARAGISHLLAISGLHFTVIVATLYNLLFLFIGRKRLCSGFAIVFAIVYALLCGASPSVVRAAFMCCFAFGTQIFMFKNDSIHSLALALLALLILNPYSALSISLQLSFLSCVGVLFISPIVSCSRTEPKLKKFIKTLSSPILFSLSATVASFPVLFFNFDFVSIASPVANIAVSLLATPMLFLGALCLLVSAFWLGAARFLAFVPFLMYNILMSWTDFFASSKYACVSIYLEGISYTVVFALIATLSALFCKAKTAVKIITVCFCLIVVNVAVSSRLFEKSFEDNTFIEYKDTASASLLVADGERSVIFDLGGKASVSSFAVQNGFTHVDYYFASSYSEASVYKLEQSLSALSVDTLVLPSQLNESYTISAFEEISLLADKADCAIMFMGDSFEFNDEFKIYTGAESDFEKSFALAIKFAGRSFLMLNCKEPLASTPLDSTELLVVSKDTASSSAYVLDSLPQFVETLYCNQKSTDSKGLGAILNLCAPEKTDTFQSTVSFRLFKDGSFKRLD